MLSFNPIETSFQLEDKGLDFSSNFDDPYNDVFGQHIGQESPTSIDNISQSHSFECLDFFIDDTTSAGSNVGGHVFHNLVNPKILRPPGFPQANLRCTQSQEVLPSQAYQRFARSEKPKPAISGAELLNLEGKLPLRTFPVRSSLTSTSATHVIPPLRRKARFCNSSPETLRQRNYKFSKSPGGGSNDSSKMMRPSYYYHHEMPSFHEWTERFEQINLQSPVNGVPSPPPPHKGVIRDGKQPRTLPLRTGSCLGGTPHENTHDEKTPHSRHALVEMTEFSPLSSSPVAFSPLEEPSLRHSIMATNGCREIRSRGWDKASISSPTPHQPSPWAQAMTSTDSFALTISPSEMHSEWPEGLLGSSDAYYENIGASQSAPALAHANVNFINPGLMIHCDPYAPFVSEDPSEDYYVTPSDPFQSTGFDAYPALPSPVIPTGRPYSPSSPLSSPCPSPSPTSKAHCKTNRRSKFSRRKPSAGALTSLNALGFVNFTPNDSQKILTGVAPSGSSKTKARREQEANEKKRKLSLAAEKVVKEAGGDVERLRASGLFA